MEKLTKKFTIRLKAEGLCFICLRDYCCDCELTGREENSTPSLFRLRNIARFVGLEMTGILKAYLSCDLGRCSDVKVELCEECGELARNFSSLYQTLELTKLKLNDCVGKISSLIQEAEKDDNRIGEINRRVTHAPTKGAIADFRTGVFQKCMESLQGALPRVKLKRLPESELTAACLPREVVGTGLDTLKQVKIEASEEVEPSCSAYTTISPPITNPMEEPDSLQGQPQSKEESSVIQSKLLSEDADKSVQPATSQITGSNSESVISRRRHQTYIKSRLIALTKTLRGPGKRWSCPFCKAVDSLKGMQLHLVRHHLQTFFFPEEEHKEAALTSLQYKLVVHHILFKNIDRKRMYECPYCDTTFHLHNYDKSKLHLIKMHHLSMAERLKELQKSPVIFQKLETIRTGRDCECGAYFVGMKGFKFHREKFCNLDQQKDNNNVDDVDHKSGIELRPNKIGISEDVIESKSTTESATSSKIPRSDTESVIPHGGQHRTQIKSRLRALRKSLPGSGKRLCPFMEHDSTCGAGRDPLASEDEYLSDPENLNCIEIGEVKPIISFAEEIVDEERLAAAGQKRLEPGSGVGPTQNNCVPQKIFKVEEDGEIAFIRKV